MNLPDSVDYINRLPGSISAMTSAMIRLPCVWMVALTSMSGQVIAISAGSVIDSENGTERTNQTILIEGGKIPR